MKLFLYNNLAKTAAIVIGLNVVVGQTVTGFIGGTFNLVTHAISGVASYLLRALDADRYEHAVQTLDQRNDLTELDILMRINQVKEDALKQKMWTVMHTIAMNKLGGALHTQCGWEPARIHGYLKPVIESIPGMVYTGGDEYSENEE